ncbi:hypothetical protein IKF73_02370 [Candidatus Saccharibacteria bacterium]|nr:hypothetical protein [Candidatus Saccharibacteria bacterium]
MARRRRRSKKWLFRLGFLILVVAALVVVYLVWVNYFKDEQKIDEGEEEVVMVEEKQPEEVIDEGQAEVVEKPETVQYEGEDPNVAEELSGVVTYAGVTGEKLMIRVNINQYLSSGTCELRLLLEDDVVVYSDTAGIVSAATTSTCEGFDVPVAGWGAGKYAIIINMTAGEKTGVINGEVKL